MIVLKVPSTCSSTDGYLMYLILKGSEDGYVHQKLFDAVASNHINKKVSISRDV